MNASRHVSGVPLAAVGAAPDPSGLLGNDLASRLARKGPDWWTGLTVTVRAREAGVDLLHARAADGQAWSIRLADWNTPPAHRLQFDASLSLILGEGLAEVPAFIVDHARLALVYPPRTARTLAEHPPEAMDLGAFLELASGVAAALTRLHEAGVIHGGLSPARVLIEPDGRIRFTGFEGLSPIEPASRGERRIPASDVAYAAPELIRTESSPVDARTDLYSIGVLLYEHLVGALPLAASSIPDWLHAHVAMEAPSVRLARPDVPDVVDRILLKLMNKDPKQRYQTAAALHADLSRVSSSIAATGKAEDFPLARSEFAELPRFSTQLFGRHRALRALADHYAGFRASSDRRIVFVSGEPGAGKSTLVEALLADLGDAAVICATGKGVKLHAGTPFAPLAQALRIVLARLTGGDEQALDAARARLASLAGCGRVLADLVPDLAIVPADAPNLADVPAHLAQIRSARIIADTFGKLASVDVPLVLFMDDLQWFDQASLAVVRQLCTEPPAHVFLVGSFRADARNREPLKDLLDLARNSPAFADELLVPPLTEQDSGALVAFILKSVPDDIRPVAARVYRETDGNPFHIAQLLQRMLEEKILLFAADRQKWVLRDDDRTHRHEIGALIRERIVALPPLQRRLLQHGASLGGRVPAAFVAQRSGASLEETVRAANSLVEAGLLRRSGSDFALAHDRVLDAAYASMSPAQKAHRHLGNARQLAACRPDADPDTAFEIVSQIERCDIECLSARERPHYARILLLAARTSRAAGEAGRALHLVELMLRIMTGGAADSLDSLIFDAEWLRCDCLLALGRVDDAFAALDAVALLCRDPAAMAEVCRLRAIALTVRGSYDLAIAASLEGLRALDIELDVTVGSDALAAIYQRCLAKLDAVTIDELVALPEMTDRRARSALSLLSTLISSFFVEGELRFLHVIKIVELTLAHGAAPESAYGLAWFGVLGAHYFGDYAQGAAYALAASTLARRDGYEAQRTAALLALDQVSAWTLPMRTALGHARDGARVGQAAGDLGMACYARNHIASDMLVMGTRLDWIRSELADSIAMTRRIGYGDIELILAAQLAFVEALGVEDVPDAIPDGEIDASSVATRFWVRHYAGLQSFFLGRLENALRHLEEAEVMAWAAPAHIDTANNCFYLALAHARVTITGYHSAGRLDRMAVARERFRSWAALNPETFSCKHLLLEAEAARLAGRRIEAMELYEQAAAAAARARFVHDQALAQELASCLYGEMNLQAPAQGCLRSAIQCYRDWGAEGKAAQLARHLPMPTDFRASPVAPARLQDELDLSVMTTAAQTLAEEVGLEQVVRSLMKSMIIHAGAQSGVLLLMRHGEPLVEAVARVRAQAVEIDLRPSAAADELMPPSVLKTVLRTGKAVTLADAAVEAAQRGLSLAGRSIRSLACIPLVKRGDLVGLLYLENALAADVFTPRRIAMLEVLAPQAAVSLDAARLYGDLMDENLRRAQAEFQLREARSELARANQLTAMGSFATSIAHEINQPLASVIAQANAGLRWLNRAQPDLAEVANSLQSIGQAGRRAADIIAALRSLVTQSPPKLGLVAIEDVVDDVLKLVAGDLAEHGIDLAVSGDTGRAMVMANEVQIQQVVFNIVTNAIQSMAGVGARERRLRIGMSLGQDDIEVAIEDTGCGMSDDVVARVFQPFFTTKASGMGVGLAICRSIMELHGGSLAVRSVPDRGSMFLVRIPRAPG